MSLTQAIILSMMPIAEARGGIPWAIASGISPLNAFIFCTLANLLVIPMVFLFFDFAHKHLLVFSLYKKLSEAIIERARKKADSNIKKWGYLGLMIFVAIPLPITGAYTGATAAWFFGLRGRKAYIYLSLGVLVAGAIVTLAVITGVDAFRVLIAK